VAAQRLEKWLEAAVHRAAQGPTLDFDLADTKRALDLLRRRNADERDLDSLQGKLFSHRLERTEPASSRNRWNHRSDA